MIHYRFTTVIPAKAGIHPAFGPGIEVSWAPAFAGVTNMGVSE